MEQKHLVVIGNGFTELGKPLAGRVAMVLRVGHGLDDLVDGNLGGGKIGVAKRSRMNEWSVGKI